MARYLTVVPVVDYEPSPVASPLCGRPAPPVLRRSRTRRAVRTASPATSAAPFGREVSTARAAAAFTDVALRSILEVVDGRRAMSQLRPLLAPGLIDTVVNLARSSRSGPARPAILRRVQVRIVDRDGRAAEVFATYTRGERVRAIAGRVERSLIRGSARWRLVALQVG